MSACSTPITVVEADSKRVADRTGQTSREGGTEERESRCAPQAPRPNQVGSACEQEPFCRTSSPAQKNGHTSASNTHGWFACWTYLLPRCRTLRNRRCRLRLGSCIRTVPCARPVIAQHNSPLLQQSLVMVMVCVHGTYLPHAIADTDNTKSMRFCNGTAVPLF